MGNCPPQSRSTEAFVLSLLNIKTVDAQQIAALHHPVEAVLPAGPHFCAAEMVHNGYDRAANLLFQSLIKLKKSGMFQFVLKQNIQRFFFDAFNQGEGEIPEQAGGIGLTGQ